ncbi:MAG: class I SAM-dependent methyltransferase [Oscillospiraceae bacterium]|jgi:SAM-dependent methyltransferase|nr:class I SAM-dependent methyltransferase [Oscillospiraceae bacterium]
MENNTSNMDQRLTFNADLENYEKWRTNYCGELFSKIIEYSGIGSGKLAVEVGCGTGKSTEPVLKTGGSVIGVEFGENLALYVKDKFAIYNNFQVKNMKFEDFTCAGGSVDLVYSGSAFHWIPEEIGYKRAFDMLRPGGTLALFWSFPAPDTEKYGLKEKLQSVYDRYDPNERLKPNDKSYGQRTPNWRR